MNFLRNNPRLLRLSGLTVIVILVTGFLTRSHWRAPSEAWLQRAIPGYPGRSPVNTVETPDADAEHSRAGHAYAPNSGESLTLSPQAQANIGLTSEYLQPIRLGTFRRSVTIPGIIVGRPGRTRLEISTPIAGVVTHVHVVQGEAVAPGTLLFDLRITAEALVATQTSLLRTVGELNVENREIARLSRAAQGGAISEKTLLERQYAKEKLEVLLNAQREALRLHGLSERQIDDIAGNQKLLRDLRIVAPGRDQHAAEELKLSGRQMIPVSVKAEKQDHDSRDGSNHDQPEHDASGESVPDEPLLILNEVLVHKGETVSAGAALGALADYSELYIEGRAFEQDIDLLTECARRDWKITAIFEGAGNSISRVENLELLYSASEVDPDARSLSFFVRLPNEVSRKIPSPNGQSFLEWKYRPGQRLRLQVPVEEWADQIVLPVEAVATEGAESFVFQQNGDHFDRVSVRVSYRDASHVVVANDGSIFPGDVIAMRGAFQMQMTLKNKAGGAVDPHAGHNH